jgi:glycosyltransferase involved in cell wall biosynthesis
MKWWAERMNIEIAKILEADIATAIWSPDCYDARGMGFTWEITQVNPWFRRGMFGFFIMKARFFFSQNLLQWYDKVFFSNEAITAIWWVKSWTPTFYYAHSISRHLFDQYELYLSKVSNIIKPFYQLFAYFLRKLYIQEIKKIWTIFVNSRKNKERMKEWIGRDDAIILYPPVDIQKFSPTDENTLLQTIAIEWISISNKDYYVSFSRLTHAKRIDIIINAFKEIPDKKVLILYGENDSQKNEFMKLGEWYQNIIFHSLKNNEHLPHIISGALASIAISQEEDFGMVAIESMACGVPVIAVDEWGYRESILEGGTGFFISGEWLKENLINTIQTLQKENLNSMKEDCIKRAQDFSIEKFREQLLHYLQ